MGKKKKRGQETKGGTEREKGRQVNKGEKEGDGKDRRERMRCGKKWWERGMER